MKTNDVTTDNFERQPVLPLASLWQHRMTTMFGHTQQPLTPKQLGQLKMVRKRLGYWAELVESWTLDNWSRFSKKAMEEAGLSSAPNKPHIGFLLAHCHTAVNLMYDTANSSTAVTKDEGWLKEMVNHMMADLMKQQEEELQKLAEFEAEEEAKAGEISSLLKNSA